MKAELVHPKILLDSVDCKMVSHDLSGQARQSANELLQGHSRRSQLHHGQGEKKTEWDGDGKENKEALLRCSGQQGQGRVQSSADLKDLQSSGKHLERVRIKSVEGSGLVTGAVPFQRFNKRSCGQRRFSGSCSRKIFQGTTFAYSALCFVSEV